MSNHKFEQDLAQQMGLMSSYRWAEEPLGVLFMLARYKWCAKMLSGYQRVVEVGCGDGFGARIVRPSVGHLTGIDIDAAMIESARANQAKFKIDFACTDLVPQCDAIYSLDVIEHMPFADSENWVAMLSQQADCVIIGTPSLESQPYASPLSRANHINCMTQAGLRSLMNSYFKHVFIHSMNDEIVSTGYAKMSHYNFALGLN